MGLSELKRPILTAGAPNRIALIFDTFNFDRNNQSADSFQKNFRKLDPHCPHLEQGECSTGHKAYFKLN